MNNAKRIAKSTGTFASWTIGGVFRVILRIISALILIFLTTGLLFTCIFAVYVKTSLTTDLEVNLEDFTISQTSYIYFKDKATDTYVQQTALYSSKNSVWVDYQNIPHAMELATIAIEDKRFYEHKGVDWYRTVAAFGNMFLSMKEDFGGSTLTQQLIKGLTGRDEATVQRKLIEIFRALEFEKNYTKEEILEGYLNIIYLGESCYGVGTAAETYFDKDVRDLTLAECAAIVGITNNPSRYDPYVNPERNKERQETILRAMYEQEYITYDEYIQAVNEKLNLKRAPDEPYKLEIRSWYEDQVINDVIRDLKNKKGLDGAVAERLLYNGGYQIYACIDTDIQAIVDNIYLDPSNFSRGWSNTTQQLQSACIIMDPYTGDIVAMSGGVGEKTGNLVLNRATDKEGRRPVGSSIKPIASYSLGFETGLLTQRTLVNDSAGIRLKGTTWYPSNSGGGNSGVVEIRTALQKSLNTVAAQIVDKLGPENCFQWLTQHLGVENLDPADAAYAPMALGELTVGITVREMAQAYGAFANDGTFTYGRTYSYITDSEGNMVIDNKPETIQAMQPNTAWNMTDMLYNAVNAGTGTEARLSNMPVAGKTGTTTSEKNRYFVGFTPYYVCAVWTGFDVPVRMGVSGNPAAQTFRKLMAPIHANLPWKSFPTPTIGAATNAFGDNLSIPTDSPTPSPSESPTPSPS